MRETGGNRTYQPKDLIKINAHMGVSSYVSAILEGLRAQRTINREEFAEIRDYLPIIWRGLSAPRRKLVGIKSLSEGFVCRDVIDTVRIFSGRRMALELKDGNISRDLRADLRETVLTNQPVIAWENGHAIIAVKYRPAGYLRETLEIKDALDSDHRPMDVKEFSELILHSRDRHLLVVKNPETLIH